MAAVRLLLRSHLLIFFFLFLSFFPLSLSLSENEALLKLKKSLVHTGALDSWVPSSNPCQGPWDGLICLNGIVTGLRLGSMDLSGNIDVDALIDIRGLRTISLTNNSFSGPLPAFNRLGSLKGLYLTRNQFTGEIPSDYFSTLTSLKKLWLSKNKFTGQIPKSVMQLTHLMELHLDDNQFSGPIPSTLPLSLKSLGLSNNKLEGEIPETLAKFDAKAFEGNEGLCGKQLGKQCEQANKALSPSPPPPPPSPEIEKSKINISKVMTMAGIAFLMIALLVFTSLVSSSRREEEFNILGKENLDEVVEIQVSGSTRKGADSLKKANGSSRRGSQHGRASVSDLVMINDEKGSFGLPDLMKAAAEVLGNGGLGSAYKAVMANGLAVVVKRMREINRLGRDSFDAQIRKIGRLRHENILTPLAYHYRKEEKLLISEYVPKGSLLYVMHGDRGISHSELNWPTRLKIIQGIASGMNFLHSEFASLDLPHGNLKSSNILLDEHYVPLLTDYAFYPLVNATQASQAMFAYRAQDQHVSPKCDVYCLGIVILEIITGKFPSQYLSNGKGGTDVVQWVKSAIEENRETELIDPEIASEASESEMQRLLQIAAECTESNPENRLDMKEAIRRIQEIKV